MRLASFTLALAIAASAAPDAQTVARSQTTFEIERELRGLPAYGVFDFIAFDLQNGKVTLVGYAYNGAKSQAERAVKRIPGVDIVENRIEQLPASSSDDRIRWATYYRIYSDTFLSRYAPGGPLTAQYELSRSRSFLGLQPFGTYPIHIIVKNGRTQLVGVVDNQMDKQMAEIRAREVSGVFAVENQITIDGE